MAMTPQKSLRELEDVVFLFPCADVSATAVSIVTQAETMMAGASQKSLRELEDVLF